MRRGDVIDGLVAELAPVRRLRGPDTRACRWAALAIACIGLGCYGLGTRPDLAQKLLDAGFVAQSAALSAMAGLAARHVLRRSIPGAGAGAGGFASMIASLVWLVLVLRGPAGADELTAPWTAGWACVARVAGLALLPTIALLGMMRRAVPTAHRRNAALALAAAAALGVVGTQWMCAKDGTAHVLRWHAGPLALAALAGLAAGRALLRSHARLRPV